MRTRHSTAILALALVLSAPLAADNQVVLSPKVEAMTTETTTAEWQSYVDQLGVDTSGHIDTTSSDLADIMVARTYRAAGDPDYPVTPGDVYTLVYSYGGEPVSVDIQIPHTGRASVTGIGDFVTTGRSYRAFREEVEQATRAAYPYANPQMSIRATAVFPVSVTGVAKSSSSVEVWGLARLSEITGYASDSASTRDVIVTSSDGTVTHYDLYAAKRGGDLTQDPLLKPGDVVRFTRRGDMVLLSGAVVRPGTYQIDEGATVDDLIDSYGQGLDSKADINSIKLTRESGGVYVESIVEYGAGVVLEDGDMVEVEALTLPVGSVTVEGALQTDATPISGTGSRVMGEMSAKYFYRFVVGDTLEDMLVQMSEYFTASSDLDGALLERDGTSYPISIRDILYGNDPDGDLSLRNGDRLYIPFSNRVVTVNGGVNNPGTYGYVQGKDVSYYVNLAGGLTSSAKGIDKYTLYNSYGEKVSDDTPITAEMTIEMDVSNFTRDAAVATTIIGIVTSLLAIATSVINFATGNT